MIQQGTFTYEQISEKYGVSKARISQINSRYYEDLPDDGSRDIQRAKLEKAQETVLRIMNGPGKRVVSPGGSPVFERNDDGTINYDKPLYDEEIKIKAALAATTISERLHRAYGWDRPKQKQKDESEEFESAMQYLETLSKENKELQKRLELYEDGPVYEAEVIEPPEIAPVSP